LNKQLGHVSGAAAFMKKIALKEKAGLLAYYFATHSHPRKRVKALQNEIRSKGYNTKGSGYGY